MKKTKEKAGITLIAMIITIIVMLILAGVSLNAVIGENGILMQAISASEATVLASENEAIQYIVVEAMMDESGSSNIGTPLYDKTLANGSIWNIVVINDTQTVYGTGWYYIEAGTEISDYGEAVYGWLINYDTGEIMQLEDNSYTQLDYSSSLAVTDGLIFNIDPTILEGVTEEELQTDTSILGDNVELINFDWTEDSGLTSTSFNFDGEDDHINILYEDEDSLTVLYENGLTFEFYGTVEEGAHVDYNGNTLSRSDCPWLGVFGLWNGDEADQCKLRFCLGRSKYINVSVLTGDASFLSPYSLDGSPWNVTYAYNVMDGNVHYWVWSLDCTEVYDSVEGYEGQEFYSSKVFVDGELVYDTYYSKDQYDYLQNNQDSWNLKYFTMGRCSNTKQGWWHYADMSVYTMRLYNKGLTEEEMLENYNVTRAYYSTMTSE